MYEVRLTENTQKEAKKRLDNQLYERLLKRVQKLETNPKSYGKPLKFPLAGTWELYFEHRYRILYEIDEGNKIVWITGVKHKDQMS